MPGVKRPFSSMELDPSRSDKRRVSSSRSVHMEFFGKLLEGSFNNLAEVGKIVSEQRVANRSRKMAKTVYKKKTKISDYTADRPYLDEPQNLQTCTSENEGQRIMAETWKNPTSADRVSTSLHKGKRNLSSLLDCGVRKSAKKRRFGRSVWDEVAPRYVGDWPTKENDCEDRGNAVSVIDKCVGDHYVEIPLKPKGVVSHDISIPSKERGVADHDIAIPVSLDDIVSEQCYDEETEDESTETVIFLTPVERIWPSTFNESGSETEIGSKRDRDDIEYSPAKKRRLGEPIVHNLDASPNSQPGLQAPNQRKNKRPQVEEPSSRKRQKGMMESSATASKLINEQFNESHWQTRHIPRSFFQNNCPRNRALDSLKKHAVRPTTNSNVIDCNS